MTNKNSILIEVSNRHVHLSRKDVQRLFGEDYKLKISRELSQPGQFVCFEKINLIWEDKIIENVKILGPEREETQVELLKSDADYFGLKIPVRMSGFLENTPEIIMQGPKGNIKLEKGVILSKKHVHASPEEAKELGIKDGQEVKIKFIGEDNKEYLIEEITVRVGEKHKLAVHIDKDEANLFKINRQIYGELG